jgi:REP element-mobilizing transposase RayT
MKRNKLALYLHLVWATWDRAPWVTPDIERRLHRNIADQARVMGCTILALNGVPDHIHLVVSLPATVAIANLVKQVKGVSSHFAGQELGLGPGFKWQGVYGAFTVSRWDLDRVVAYVKRQKEHHASNELVPEWEQVAEEEDRPVEPRGR